MTKEDGEDELEDARRKEAIASLATERSSGVAVTCVAVRARGGGPAPGSDEATRRTTRARRSVRRGYAGKPKGARGHPVHRIWAGSRPCKRSSGPGIAIERPALTEDDEATTARRPARRSSRSRVRATPPRRKKGQGRRRGRGRIPPRKRRFVTAGGRFSWPKVEDEEISPASFSTGIRTPSEGRTQRMIALNSAVLDHTRYTSSAPQRRTSSAKTDGEGQKAGRALASDLAPRTSSRTRSQPGRGRRGEAEARARRPPRSFWSIWTICPRTRGLPIPDPGPWRISEHHRVAAER